MILTEKEYKIAEMKLKRGLSNREIAKRLRVSESYVSKTLKNILRKMTTIKSTIEVYKELGLIKDEKIEIDPEVVKSIHKKAIAMLKAKKISIPTPHKIPKIKITPVTIKKREKPEETMVIVKTEPTLTYIRSVPKLFIGTGRIKTIWTECKSPVDYGMSLFGRPKPVFYNLEIFSR